MAATLSAPRFQNEEAAYAHIEARLWPDGPVCAHCGGVDKITKLAGKSTRLGVYKCNQCRKPFTVKVGTIFESSHVPLNVWLQAMYLISGSKKGISSNQLHRMLGVTLKTAWFMGHRIREAMRSGDLTPFGSDGGIVEADETFIGRIEGRTAKQGYHHKHKILALVDRDSGHSRAFVIDRVHAVAIAPIILKNMAREARLFTDEATAYSAFSLTFADHQRVRHGAGEYGRGEVHTNTIEGYFSIFKRGMRGIYQWCGEKHLHRYLAEYDFRYTNRQANGFNDAERADKLLLGVVGRRLTYQTSCGRA
jgi:transposase-like protein